MRSAIDARGSTIAAAVALLAGIALIGGTLLRVGDRAPSVDVASLTIRAAAKTHPVEQTAARKAVDRESRVGKRATPVRVPYANAGAPDVIGLAADDLALPSPALTATGPTLHPQAEASGGLAAAATEFGDGLARGSQKAGARTAGFFKRFSKKVAASFGR
jgi:hypothetical protein